MMPIHVFFSIVLLSIATPLFADRPVIAVWPGTAPGETGDIGPEQVKDNKGNITRLTNVTRPTLTVYKPDKAIDTGAAIVICPGGGYSILAMDLEGEEVAQWANSIGVTGIVLKYRVPVRKDRPRHLPPLQDAQRAMRVVRSQAEQLGIDPKRVGILGFSAGGHLAATTSTNEKLAYDAIDEIDKLDGRPNFTVLVYPAYLTTGEGLVAEVPAGAGSPPAFLVHAGDDKHSAENSVMYYLALKRAGVKAELHVYASGGHGFGLRPTANPVCTWPQRCAEWLKASGMLEKSK